MAAERFEILVVDDEPAAREGLDLTLGAEGYVVIQAASGNQALEILSQPSRAVDLVITDLRMPGGDGMALLDSVRQRWPDIDVILITGYATVDSAVSALKKGAFDYLTKPFNLDAVRQSVRRALERRGLQRENFELKKQLDRLSGLDRIIGQSQPMEKVFALVRQVAPSQATVLVTGESGTGKELVARAIHFSSPRAAKPFVTVNCASLSEPLLENELFGHEKGAYTDARDQKAGLFEAAGGGTLFLDEIGEISAALQVRLLRVIQEREVTRVGATAPVKVDVRLITATNRDLAAEVAAVRFRQDLYYRLNVISIPLPPLRDRADDVPLLAQHFFLKFRDQDKRKLEGITKEALEVLRDHTWPGNVRELENVVERAVILCQGTRIEPRDLPDALVKRQAQGPSDLHTLDEHERDYILFVLGRCEWNLTRAARVLGLNRSTLWRRIKIYGFQGKDGAGTVEPEDG